MVEGQIRWVQRMVDDESDCVDVLNARVIDRFSK